MAKILSVSAEWKLFDGAEKDIALKVLACAQMPSAAINRLLQVYQPTENRPSTPSNRKGKGIWNNNASKEDSKKDETADPKPFQWAYPPCNMPHLPERSKVHFQNKIC